MKLSENKDYQDWLLNQQPTNLSEAETKRAYIADMEKHKLEKHLQHQNRVSNSTKYVDRIKRKEAKKNKPSQE